MRILYHHRTLSDGAEGLQLASVVNAFRAPGHDVKVVSLVGNKNIAARRRAGIVEQVRRYMPRWVYELMEMGYNLPGYHMLTSRVNGWIPEFLYERYSLFNLSGLMTARRPGIPLVLEVNSPLAYERTQYEHLSWKRGAKISEGFLLSRADIVLTVSTPLKDYLVDQGILADKIVVIPNGVDPEIFRPDPQRRVNVRSRFGIPEDGIVVGFIGILRPCHGVELLLEVLARIRKSSTAVRLLVVGDGPSRDELQKIARSVGLTDRMIFIRIVHSREVAHFIAALDIAVSPRATFDASPMKVLEYMATGIAVVAPRMPNLQDLITHGVDGILFRPEDAGDLVSALLSLIRDPNFRTKLAENARATIVRDRTWLHNARQVIGLVDRLPQWN